MRIGLWWVAIAVLIATGLLSGCTGGVTRPTHSSATGGYQKRGKQWITERKCGSCHTIPGIHGANGVFGPPLNSFGARTYIAGEFPNAPKYLVPWIMAPQLMKPKTSMPDLGLSEQQARDVAAYLYTLR
jgi:cytochrome c